uniref:Uncharacterized protein n=1 Tax=viral metagenome TaxID=1070528 RepID=A0A6C0IZX0_9ZZZZ
MKNKYYIYFYDNYVFFSPFSAYFISYICSLNFYINK